MIFYVSQIHVKTFTTLKIKKYALEKKKKKKAY